jgi:4-amino-4-deoxy-L-arabinose transferase-like glycosyltransferase
MNARAAPGKTREALIVALAFSPVLLSLRSAIQEIDPAQYAEVGRHVLLSRQWGHLEDAFGPYLNKPPLVFWLIALSLRVLGVGAAAVRTPSVIAGVFTVWATYRMGQRLWDNATGVVAAAFTASSVAVQVMIADPKIDMVLTACVTGAVWCCVEGRSRPVWMWGAWAFGGLGLLAKGPIGLTLPMLAVVPEALRAPWREGAPGARLADRLRPLHLVVGPLLAAAINAPWFVAQFDWWGWGGIRFHLWEQGPGRFLSTATWRNDAGPLFFVHTALWAFLPMTPVLVWELGRRALALLRTRQLPPDGRRIVLWWLVIDTVVISASSYKLPQYLFPMAPAAALLAAHALPRWSARATTVVGAALAIAALGLIALLGWVCFPLPLPSLSAWVLGSAVAIGLAGAWARRASAPAVASLPLVLPLVCFHAFFLGHVHPALLAYQPDEGIARAVREADPLGRVVPFVGMEQLNGVAFLTEREAAQVEAPRLAELVAQRAASLAVLTASAREELLAHGWSVSPVAVVDAFATSRPTWRFLRASTRASVLDHLTVAHVAPKDATP